MVHFFFNGLEALCIFSVAVAMHVPFFVPSSA